jgi:hypothetical protein
MQVLLYVARGSSGGQMTLYLSLSAHNLPADQQLAGGSEGFLNLAARGISSKGFILQRRPEVWASEAEGGLVLPKKTESPVT